MIAAHSFMSLLTGIGQWGSWQWKEPQWLWLFFLLPFFFYRSWRSRRSIFYPVPKFFESRSVFCAILRLGGLLIAGIIALIFILALAHPIMKKTIEEKSGTPKRVYVEVDTSGSMNCDKYAPLVQYFDTLMEESERQKLQIDWGVYFFSSTNLLQMFPGAPRERITHAVVRYGPTGNCNAIVDYFERKYKKPVGSALNTGAGTEPAPSILEIIFDVIRAGSPEAELLVRHIQEEKGFADDGGKNTIPLSHYFPESRRAEIIKKLREGARGSRILFLTDAEFDVTDNVLAFSRVAELAALMKLPIDLVAFKSSRAGLGGMVDTIEQTAITKVLGPTGGAYHVIAKGSDISPSIPLIRELLKYYAALPANFKITPKTIFDETPRQTLFVWALLIAALWMLLRWLYIIVDY